MIKQMLLHLNYFFILPLTIPEYQHTFNYFDVNGNYFLVILYIHGRIYTIIPRTIGNIGINKSENPNADHFPDTLKIEAPKYAYTKAYATYATV